MGRGGAPKCVLHSACLGCWLLRRTRILPRARPHRRSARLKPREGPYQKGWLLHQCAVPIAFGFTEIPRNFHVDVDEKPVRRYARVTRTQDPAFAALEL